MVISQDTLEKLKKKVHEDTVLRDSYRKKLESYEQNLTILKERLSNAEQAQFIIQEVAQQTQSNLEFHISNIVTTALKAVSTDFPEFVARIVPRRDQTECDLLFSEDGNEYPPLEGAGYGAVDVACFALRIAYWMLKPNRPCFALDEPFRNVSPDLQGKVSEMAKMITEKKNIQIIMVSHAEDINISADRTFQTVRIGKISHVSQVNETGAQSAKRGELK